MKVTHVQANPRARVNWHFQYLAPHHLYLRGLKNEPHFKNFPQILQSARDDECLFVYEWKQEDQENEKSQRRMPLCQKSGFPCCVQLLHLSCHKAQELKTQWITFSCPMLNRLTRS